MSEKTPKQIDFIAEISTAADSKGLLEAYTVAREKQPGKVEELQRAVGKRFVELGDTSKGAQFLILADYTAVQNTALEAAGMFIEASRTNGQTTARLETTAGKIMAAAQKMEDSVGMMGSRIGALDQALSPLQRSAERMYDAANMFSRAAAIMDESARVISHAAGRMQGGR